MKEYGIKEQEAWILGGSSGLGLRLALEATRRNIVPVVFGRNVNDQKRLVDLSDRESVLALCRSIRNLQEQELRRVLYFVWNASVFEERPLWNMDDLGAMVAINILNPTTIVQALVEAKEKIGSPFHLVTIASRAAWKAWPDQAVYCGSKAFQAQFSRALARELERDLKGSRVTIVMPGGIKTNIFNRTSIDPSRFMDPEVVAEMIWHEVLEQQRVCDWFNVLQQDGQPTVSRDNFVPELAYEQLPRRTIV